MKQNLLILICCIALMCFHSCQKTPVDLRQKLISQSEDGWLMQSYTVYSGDISDHLNSDIIFHYKNIGQFKFNSDQTGTYTLFNEINEFTWTLTDNIIVFEIVDKNHYTSPFIFYYFAGYYNSPFISSPEDYIKRYNLIYLNENTLQFTHDKSGSTSGEEFGALEFILSPI